jgi:hypothetical protein
MSGSTWTIFAPTLHHPRVGHRPRGRQFTGSAGLDDGYRTQAHLQEGQPAIHTRAGHDWTRRFQTIADALAALPANYLILDGEAVVADSRGVPDFGLLHADLAAGRTTGCSTTRSTCSISTGSICAGRALPSASACWPSCWPAHPSASSTRQVLVKLHRPSGISGREIL